MIHTARLTDEAPESPREAEARERVTQTDCHSRWSVLLPGYIQFCRGRTFDGTLLASLGGLELGSAITASALNGIDSSSAEVPALMFGDLLTLSVMDAALENQRALNLRYVPQENLTELMLAPFSGEVLKRPLVWGGIVGSLAAGVLVTRLISGPFTSRGFGTRPVLFGATPQAWFGYPAATALGIGVFEHVAIAEESTFRGLLQSSWSRQYGEDRGLIYGSLAFGLLHASNIIFMDASDRPSYLAAGVPFITLLGFYLGTVYRQSDYSLAPTVAIHFWYDFLIETIGFLGDPKSSPLSMSWGIPF